MPRLKIMEGGGSRILPFEPPLVVGRSEESDLTLEDNSCSRKHFEIAAGAAGLVVRDLGSSNGTLVNGSKISEQPLEDHDQIKVGATRLEFLASEADFVLRFTAGEHAGDSLPLAKERTTLGRKPENDRSFKDIKVSGMHLEVVAEGDHHVLRDLGSTNGTLLDGKKVEEVILSHGDTIRIGEQEFVYESVAPGATATEPTGDSSAARTLDMPQQKRGNKLVSLIALLILLGAIGGGGFFYFRQSSKDGGGRAGPKARPAPEGTLLVEDWSFEDGAAVGSRWANQRGNELRQRRSYAASGSFHFGTELDGGVAIASRSAVELRGGSAVKLSGQWAVDDGCLLSLSARAIRSGEDDTVFPAATMLVAQSAGNGGRYEEFEAPYVLPEWADRLELLVVARGRGAVRLDDLAMIPGESPGAPLAVAQMTLRSRGASFVMEHRAPLVELFQATGTEQNAGGDSVDLPPGSFVVDVTRDGKSLHYQLGSAEFAPPRLVAWIYPEVAAAGITILRPEQAADAVASVLVGSAAERMELKFDPPARISTVPFHQGLELRLLPSFNEQTVTVRGDFSAEQKAASDLYVAAQQAKQAERLGPALQHLRTIQQRYPYNERIRQQATELEATIFRTVNARIDEITVEADAAEFLDSLDRYQAVLRRADELLAQLKGSELIAELETRIHSMRERARVLAKARTEKEAARILRLAEAYEAAGRTATATELKKAIAESYRDTEAGQKLNLGGS